MMRESERRSVSDDVLSFTPWETSQRDRNNDRCAALQRRKQLKTSHAQLEMLQ